MAEDIEVQYFRVQKELASNHAGELTVADDLYIVPGLANLSLQYRLSKI